MDLNLLCLQIKGGWTVESVVKGTTSEMAQLHNAILTGSIHVVTQEKMEYVGIQLSIAHARIAQTTGLFTGIGGNLVAHKCGGLTKSVATQAPYQMVHLHNVILMGRTRVVMMSGLAIVVIIVVSIQTTE